jgi:Dolichyl-phosphate-mannose-protein mannosyltransferase
MRRFIENFRFVPARNTPNKRLLVLLTSLWLIWVMIVLRFQFANLWYILLGDTILRTDLFSGVDPLQWSFLLVSGVIALGLTFVPRIWRRTHSKARRYSAAGGLFLSFVIVIMVGLWYNSRYPTLTQFPALGEALTRTIGGIGGVAIVLLASLTCGSVIAVLMKWTFDHWRETLLYRLSIGLGVLAYLSLGLAFLGVYSRRSVLILLAGMFASGLILLIRPSSMAKPQNDNNAVSYPPVKKTSNYDFLWKAVVILALLIGLAGALAPEIEYDALWYHLWLPKQWLVQGHPVDYIEEYVSLYPMTWELVFGAGMSVGGGAVAAKLLHFACLPLTGLLVYEMTRRYAPSASAWLAVALCVTIPTILWEATTAYIDLALAFYVTLTLYALLRYFDTHQRMWFVLTAINLGLALAIKNLALFVLIIVSGSLFIHVWWKERNLMRVVRSVALFIVLCLIFPLPWYLRSWLASGNPFFPDMFQIFGAHPPERWNAITELELTHFKERFGQPLSLKTLITLPWNMTIHGASYRGSLGASFLMLLPGLALYKVRLKALPWLITFAVAYILLWASPISSFQLRFIIPIMPILAVLAAIAFGQLSHAVRIIAKKWGEGALQLGLIAVLFLNFPSLIPLQESDRLPAVYTSGWLTHVIRQSPLQVLVGEESENTYLAESVPSYNAWMYIDNNLPQTARILTSGGGDDFYAERNRLLFDATMARPATWGASQGQEIQALNALQQLHITHILFDKRDLESTGFSDLAIEPNGALAACYELQYQDKRFLLYRIRWEAIEISGSKGLC